MRSTEILESYALPGIDQNAHSREKHSLCVWHERDDKLNSFEANAPVPNRELSAEG